MSAAGLRSRRSVLAGLSAAFAGLLAGGVGRGHAAAARPAGLRVATLDWAVLETLLAIGEVPVAAAELVLYRDIVVAPRVSSAVADLGLRGMPNYEALLAAHPTLIINTGFYLWAEPALARIAPIERVNFYGVGGPVLDVAVAATRTIAGHVERTGEGAALIERTDDTLATLGKVLAGAAARPVLVINFGDERHFRVFGPDSLFGAVLTRLGLTNAWVEPTQYSATAPIGLERLAGFSDAVIIVLPPVPPDAARMFGASRFWAALPPVREGRVVRLPPVNPFGALPTAERFATLLHGALMHEIFRG